MPVTIPYRSIVKDGYTTDADDRPEGGQVELEIASWKVEIVEPEEEESIKDDDGNLQYHKILRIALSDVGSEELARRTNLKSYQDDRGGRAASTIRGYRQRPDLMQGKPRGGLGASHPVKRVLRRYARSTGLGHFEDDEAGEDPEEIDPEQLAPIDLGSLMAAFRLARSIASQEGFVFVSRQGDPVAIEDNERIDHDEIRRHDRPTGDVKAAVLCTKANGLPYEYEVDLDEKKLISGGSIPPGGWT